MLSTTCSKSGTCLSSKSRSGKANPDCRFNHNQTPKTPMDDILNPTHYNHRETESIELMKKMSTREEFEGYLKLNAFKYLYRYKHKGDPVKDLQKARQYINALINNSENPEVVNVFRDGVPKSTDDVVDDGTRVGYTHSIEPDLTIVDLRDEGPMTLEEVFEEMERRITEEVEKDQEQEGPSFLTDLFKANLEENRKRFNERISTLLDEVEECECD